MAKVDLLLRVFGWKIPDAMAIEEAVTIGTT